MNIPNKDFTVKIGAYEWKVLYQTDKMEDLKLFGQCRSDHQEISLAHTAGMIEIPSQKIEQTFIHEVLHALYWQRGLQVIENPSEEQIVDLLSQGLYSFIQDNKKLFK